MRKYNPSDSEVFVDESGKVQFKYQQESRIKPNSSDWEGRARISKKARKASAADIKKAMNKVHGLTKKHTAALSSIPIPALTSFINQLSTLVSDKEEPNKPEIKEGKYRSKFKPAIIAKGVDIALSMSGNMTGAHKRIEAFKKGLADDPMVKKALRLANESVEDVNEAPLVMDDMAIIRSILKKIEDNISKAFLKKKHESVWPMLQTLAKFAGYGISKKAQAKGRTFRYDLKK